MGRIAAPPAVYACDVGSTRATSRKSASFAWARFEDGVSSAHLSDIEGLVRSLGDDLTAGRAVALGFEAPLFIPVPENAAELSAARANDGNRAWSAPAGLAVSTLAVHQAAWILRALRIEHRRSCTLVMRPDGWPPQGQGPSLFLWEAFVSGRAHSKCHRCDAVTAVLAFDKYHKGTLPHERVTAGDSALSLIGAAVLWSGWSKDTSLLDDEVLVVKPSAQIGNCGVPPCNGEA